MRPAEVLVAAPERARGRLGVAVLLAVAFHAVGWVVLAPRGPGLEEWAARIAARVHARMTLPVVVDLATPLPELDPPEPAAPPASEARVAAPPSPTSSPRRPVTPAAAAPALVGEAEPVDLTQVPWAEGAARGSTRGGVYSEGAESPAGGAGDPARPEPTASPQAPAMAPASRDPDRSRPVSLVGDEWQCEWPATARTATIEEQAVVLRVRVRADGTVRSATLVTDPGFGFGEAALACARRMVFTPALGRDGTPVEADSPAIRVHFVR
jgi:protein TonB